MQLAVDDNNVLVGFLLVCVLVGQRLEEVRVSICAALHEENEIAALDELQTDILTDVYSRFSDLRVVRAFARLDELLYVDAGELQTLAHVE